jgi:hypothetical protein
MARDLIFLRAVAAKTERPIRVIGGKTDKSVSQAQDILSRNELSDEKKSLPPLYEWGTGSKQRGIGAVQTSFDNVVSITPTGRYPFAGSSRNKDAIVVSSKQQPMTQRIERSLPKCPRPIVVGHKDHATTGGADLACQGIECRRSITADKQYIWDTNSEGVPTHVNRCSVEPMYRLAQ